MSTSAHGSSVGRLSCTAGTSALGYMTFRGTQAPWSRPRSACWWSGVAVRHHGRHLPGQPGGVGRGIGHLEEAPVEACEVVDQRSGRPGPGQGRGGRAPSGPTRRGCPAAWAGPGPTRRAGPSTVGRRAAGAPRGPGRCRASPRRPASTPAGAWLRGAASARKVSNGWAISARLMELLAYATNTTRRWGSAGPAPVGGWPGYWWKRASRSSMIACSRSAASASALAHSASRPAHAGPPNGAGPRPRRPPPA